MIEENFTNSFTINDYEFLIRLNIPQAPLNASIAVLQPNGTYFKLPIYLEICGYEEITPKDGIFYLDQNSLGIANEIIFELASLHINSSPNNFCPIVSYSLVDDDGSLVVIDPNWYEWIDLNDTHLIINEYIPFVNFAVMAETAMG